jgi:hypothetical protein
MHRNRISALNPYVYIALNPYVYIALNPCIYAPGRYDEVFDASQLASLAKRTLSSSGGGSLRGPLSDLCTYIYKPLTFLQASLLASACYCPPPPTTVLLLLLPKRARFCLRFAVPAVTTAAGQRMAEFTILAATAAVVSMPSRLLSVCLLRYLKDDHLRSGVSFSPWPKIIAVCGVSVALAAAFSCLLVFMLPGWTSMLLRSHFTP